MAIIIPALPYTLTNGTTADANQVMADLNDIVSGVNNNAAHNGPNSDITSLTGLTTPLSIGQGGTGVGVVGAAGTIPVSDGLAFAWGSTINGPLTVSGVGNFNGAANNIKGVVDGSSAAVGYVGEYVTVTGTAQALATNTAANTGSLTLQPGDWDVWGFVNFGITGTASVLAAVINTSVALGTVYNSISASSGIFSSQQMQAVQQRISISVATPVYMVAYATFTPGPITGQGTLYARRRR
jgi:hypothetical protein